MRMKLVTLNGPLRVGKSWTADRVEQFCKERNVRTTRVSFQDALREGAYGLLGLSSQVSYDDFKKQTYLGKTGRQWMIDLSERFAKQHDPLFFSKILHEKMRRIHNLSAHGKHLFIADSNGFDNELMYFRVAEDVDVLACCIEPPDSAPRGEVWVAEDSRCNLAHLCNLVTENSTEMAIKIQASLERRGWI